MNWGNIVTGLLSAGHPWISTPVIYVCIRINILTDALHTNARPSYI